MRPPCRETFLPSLLLLCLPARLLAQNDDAALIARVQQAALQTALDTDTAKPFHLKLAVHLDAQHGRPAEDGTAELWWSSPASHRTAYDFPTYKTTFLDTPDGHFESPDARPVPYLIEYTLDHILHPISPHSFAESQNPVFQKRSFGKVNLECIALTPLPKNPRIVAAPITYCFDPGTTTLRIDFDLAGQDSVRQVLGSFRGISVPIKFDYSFTGKPVAHADVEKLSGQALPYSETADTVGLRAVPAAATHIAATVLAGSIIAKATPIYPYWAKQNHISGSVLLHAIIGTDGRIKNLELIGSPDESLTDAAMTAVRNWIYKPYLLDGAPTEVDSTITVNFNFGPAPR